MIIGLILSFFVDSYDLEDTCNCLHHVTKKSHGTEISFGIRSNHLSLPQPREITLKMAARYLSRGFVHFKKCISKSNDVKWLQTSVYANGEY